ncbi:hypothetical protein NQZ68_015154 [Dissostichus eleginoides]|nr:hypothetical protein NQZ68_015154 [Dissostichus eleginoides]
MSTGRGVLTSMMKERVVLVEEVEASQSSCRRRISHSVNTSLEKQDARLDAPTSPPQHPPFASSS